MVGSYREMYVNIHIFFAHSHIREIGRNYENRVYSHQIRRLSYEIHNIVSIIESYTKYIPLILRIHLEKFELAVATEIIARPTTTAQLSIGIFINSEIIQKKL